MCHCIHKGGSCKYFDKGGTYKNQTRSPLKVKCNIIKHDTQEEGGTNGCFHCCNVCCAKRIYSKKGASYKGWPKRFSTRNKIIDGKVNQSFKEKETQRPNQSKVADRKIAFTDAETSSSDAKEDKLKSNYSGKKVIKNDFWKNHNHIYRYIEKHKCTHCKKSNA